MTAFSVETRNTEFNLNPSSSFDGLPTIHYLVTICSFYGFYAKCIEITQLQSPKKDKKYMKKHYQAVTLHVRGNSI